VELAVAEENGEEGGARLL
jgi:hypothetical protein